MSRLKFTGKNIIYGYMSSFINVVLKFALRTIFISMLSVDYLGVNGLFTNVLGVLSFAELGIGVAMNFALYKPVAEDDIEKTKALLHFYKKAYRVIALIVASIGLGILPFLSIIVKDPGNIGNISIYYLIFLFNTVSSYFVTYKYGLLNAKQKDYIVSNITAITTIAASIFQIIVLFIFRDFLAYLIAAAVVGLGQKIFANLYINKKFPFLKEKNVKKLTKEEIAPIKKNTIALIWHKIGSISVYQTDNIIISAFISLAVVGIVSNYNLLITSVSTFVVIIFNAAIGSFGNLVATESKEKQYVVFKTYRFVAFWIYGFCAIAFFILGTPFVTLWLGDKMTISEFTWLLIVISFYLAGDDICIGNIKSASGVFNQDKYVAIIQAITNLVVSIVLVKYIGLAGVFIGTIVQRIIGNIIKPVIVYRVVFDIGSKPFFIDWLKFMLPVLISGLICWLLKSAIMHNVTILNFVIMMLAVIIVPNMIFFVIFRKNEEFIYMKNIILKRVRRKKNA